MPVCVFFVENLSRPAPAPFASLRGVATTAFFFKIECSKLAHIIPQQSVVHITTVVVVVATSWICLFW